MHAEADKEGLQTHQSVQQAKCMLTMQRLASGNATTKHGKTALHIVPKPTTGSQQASLQDCTPSVCYQAKCARLSKHQLTCRDMTTAYMFGDA
jgi:hypothetical protein